MTDDHRVRPRRRHRRRRVRRPGRAHVRDPGRKGDAVLSVLVEKEQVALLAAEAARSSTASPRSTRSSRSSRRRRRQSAVRERRAAVPGPPHRHRLRPRARARAARAARATPADEDDEDATPPTVATTTTRATSRGSTRPARRSGRWRATASRRSTAAARRARCATSRWIPPGTSVRGGTDAPTSCRGRRCELRDGEVEVLGRMPWSSNATFLVDAQGRRRRAARDLQAAARRAPAVGLPAGTLCHREVAALRGVRGARLGHRARHGAARRPARHRHDAALRRPRSRGALLHAARDARDAFRAWPRST